MKCQFTALIGKEGRCELPKNFDLQNECGLFLVKIGKETFQAKVIRSTDRGRQRARLKIIGYYRSIAEARRKITIIEDLSANKYEFDLNDIFCENKVDIYRLVCFLLNKMDFLIGESNGKVFISKSHSMKPVSINRYVDACNFFEMLGLYQGEGLRNVKRVQKVQFSNNEPTIINKFLGVFDGLGIPRGDWKLGITLTGVVDEKRKRESSNYWLSKTGIPEVNLRAFSNTKTSGVMGNRLGTAVVIFDSSVLTEFILRAVTSACDLMVKKEYEWKYFNGLMEADGSVELRDGHLSELYLAYDTDDEAERYRKFIEKRLKIGTKIKEHKRVITLNKDLETGEKWDTWNKMVKHKIFRDHPRRRKRLLVGFYNHKNTVSMT